MTPNEFKAWFEGFTESMDGPPGAKAWERIQARVKEITGNPITERVYIDRYVDRYWPQRYATYGQMTSAGTATLQNRVGACNTLSMAGKADDGFNATLAMNALGRREAADLN